MRTQIHRHLKEHSTDLALHSYYTVRLMMDSLKKSMQQNQRLPIMLRNSRQYGQRFRYVMVVISHQLVIRLHIAPSGATKGFRQLCLHM